MRALSVAVFFCTFVAGTGALAQRARPDYASAKKHFIAGKSLFERKQYLEAAGEFKEAYEITRDPIVLFNVAEAYSKAGQSEDAIRAYEGYLVGAPTAQDREEVEHKITELKRAKPVSHPVAPAQKPAPTPPPPSVPPPAPALTPPPPPPAPTGLEPVSAAPSSGTSTLRVTAWVGVGLTAALVTTGALLALAAKGKQDDIAHLQEYRDANGQPLTYGTTTRQTYEYLKSDGESYQTLSIVCFSLSGAAALATAGLFVWDAMRHGGGERSATERAPRLRAAVTPTSASAVVGWSF